MKTSGKLTGMFVALGIFAISACANRMTAAEDAKEKAAPEIGISVRGDVGDEVEQFVPLHVAVRLEAPSGLVQPMELAPSSGTWVDAITVEIAGANGGPVIARAEAVGRSDNLRATLSHGQSAGGLWRFSGEATAQIPPGDYVVRARLAITAGSGWTGTVQSEDEPLRIVLRLASGGGIQASLARARDALLIGLPAEAARILDAELTQHPNEQALLMARARVALRGGNAVAARLCVNRALLALTRNDEHPPQALLELEDEVNVAFEALKPGAVEPAPPPWSWPPAGVLTAALPAKDAVAAPRREAPAEMVSKIPIAAKPVSVATASNVPPAAPVTPTKVMGTVVPAEQCSDAKFNADIAGQWAVSAIAGSQYGRTQYSAAQATGAPNISVAGNSPAAWCPESKDRGSDWLEVSFAKAIRATEVRVRQNDASGAITKIEAIEPDGTAHVWWEGVDPAQPSSVREIVWFAVRVPQTAYLVAKVRLTLNLAAGPGWKEIDAVQLVDAVPAI